MSAQTPLPQIDMSVIQDAMRAVFESKNGRIPADPYKPLIQSILSSEFVEGVPLRDRQPPPIDFFSDRSDTLISQLVSFGDCGCFGLKHLAKLVSEASVRRSNNVMIALLQALGNLKSEVKTKGIETLFIDVASINTCTSESLAQPLQHRYEVAVEAIVTNVKVERKENSSGETSGPGGASFDECVMAFVRRIMEEAFQAEQSEDILCADIVAVMGSNNNNIQRIDVRNMRERRQQVLSILKAATVGEGTISMEMYLKVQHYMGNFNRDRFGGTAQTGTNIQEESTGYMRISRHYRFSYCDDNSDVSRCFSRLPFESLARGVFFNGNHAKIYRDVYEKHLAKVNHTLQERALHNQRDRDKPLDDKLFTNVFFHMIKEARNAFDDGEYVYATEWLLQLTTLMCPTKNNLTVCAARLSQISSSDVGKVRAVRDALLSLHRVSEIVGMRIEEFVSKNPEVGYPQMSRKRDTVAAAKPVSKELTSIQTHYEALNKGIIELKVLILSLLRTIGYSEFRYVSVGMIKELWELFHEDRRTPLLTFKNNDENAGPLSPRMQSNASEDRLLEMSSLLSKLNAVYGKLECRLKILESSMGWSCLCNLIWLDRKRAAADGDLDFKKIDEEREKKRSEYWLKRNFDEAEWNKRDMRYAVHPWNEAPRTVWELLGYIESYYRNRMTILAEGRASNARSADMKISWYLDLDVSNDTVGTFRVDDVVTGKDVDSLVKYVLFDPWTPEHGRGGKQVGHKEKHAMALNPDGTQRRLGLWDAESILRCAPAELVLSDMVSDETRRYEAPLFLSSEAARIRYLTETHVFRAIHEGMYAALTSKDAGSALTPYFSVVSQSLFHFSVYLHLWNNMPSSTIAQFAFAPARTKDAIQYSEASGGCSVIHLPYRQAPGKLLKFISGGVFGPNRVLSGLGHRAQDIFTQAWAIPAIFEHYPVGPSAAPVHAYCGLSVATALQWGLPNYLTAKDDADEEAYLEAKRIEREQMGTNRMFGPAHQNALNYENTSYVVGLEQPPTPIEIEVVLRYNCELLSAEPRARKSFGTEVSKCIHFLSSGTDWRVRDVAVAKAVGETTTGEDGLPIPKVLRFTRQQIVSDKDYDMSMQAAASKFGFVSVECAVALVEPKPPIKEKDASGVSSSKADARKESAVLSLQLLAQALERVLGKFDAAEMTEAYDPCATDRQRVCAAEGSVCSILQDHIRKRGYSRTFVPCKINFTYLSSTPLELNKKKIEQDGDTDADSVASKRSAYRTKNLKSNEMVTAADEKLGNLSVGNEHLPRLVASTVWLSPHAAKCIWACVQKPGEVEQCYALESAARMRMCKALRNQNLCIDAIAHHKVSCLLLTKYDHFIHCTRMNTSLAANFHRTVQMVRMCRGLVDDPEITTLDVASFRITLVKYVCLGLRLGLLSPQCVHLRSGCHQILQKLLQLEGLLKIAPMPLKITKPVVVTAERAGIKTETYRIPGAVVTDEEASWDESELRKALGQPSTLQEVSEVMRELDCMCSVLLEALGRDADTLLVRLTQDGIAVPQSYQLLDDRDVVHENEHKMQLLLRETLKAQDLIQEKAMFTRAGGVKYEGQLPYKPFSPFNDTMSSLGDTFSITDKPELPPAGEATEAVDLIAAHTSRVTEVLKKSNGLSVAFGDLDQPQYRSIWISREREFAFTDTGRLLAAAASEAAAAVAAAAARGQKRANIGKRGNFARGLNYALEEDNENIEREGMDPAKAMNILNSKMYTTNATLPDPETDEPITLKRNKGSATSLLSSKSITSVKSVQNSTTGTPVNPNVPSAMVSKLRDTVGRVKLGSILDKLKKAA